MEARFSNLLTRTCVVGCLLGFVGTVYLVAGLAGLVHNAVLNLTTAAAFIAALMFFLINFFVLFT